MLPDCVRAARPSRAAYSLATAFHSVSVISAPLTTPREQLGELPPGEGEAGLVSVIVPAYNRAYLVVQTIDSILAQRYAKVEVIVADDGSRDNTREVVAAYTDPRVRYFHQQNGGLASARNLGLRHARGEFIAFLDSDDAWLPWKLSAQMALFSRLPEVGITWTDMSSFDEQSRVLQERYLRTMYHTYAAAPIERICRRVGVARELSAEVPAAEREAPFYEGDIFSHMFLGNLVHPSTAIVRRSVLQKSGGFHSPYGGGAVDYDFYFRATAYTRVAFLDAPTTLYRVGIADAMTAPSRLLGEARANLQAVTAWAAHHGDRIRLPLAAKRDRWAAAHAWLGEAALLAGCHGEAREHLVRSLSYRALQPRLAFLAALAMLPPMVVDALRAGRRRVLGWA